MFRAHHQRVYSDQNGTRAQKRYVRDDSALRMDTRATQFFLGAGTNWSPIDEPTDSHTPVCLLHSL